MTTRGPLFKAERNKSIWHDRREGMKYWEISQKYGITQARVREIYESYDRHYNKDEWKIRNNFK